MSRGRPGFWLSRWWVVSPLMKAEIPLAFLAACLTACNREHPSILFTRAAGTQPSVPQRESPCHCLPPPASLLVPPDRCKFQPTKEQGSGPKHTGLPCSTETATLALVGLLPSVGCALPQLPIFLKKRALRSDPGQKAAGWKGGPSLQLLVLSEAEPGCLWQLSWKPWCDRACLGSMLVGGITNSGIR